MLQTLVSVQLRLLFNDKERLLSPILFAATILVLFAFSQVSYDDEKQKIAAFSAQTFLSILFAIQMALYRSLEPDRDDHVFDMLRTMLLPSGLWFISRSLVSSILCFTVCIPTILLSLLFHSDIAHYFLNLPFLGLVLLVSLGLSCLGSILSMLTFHADGREILFPLLQKTDQSIY